MLGGNVLFLAGMGVRGNNQVGQSLGLDVDPARLGYVMLGAAPVLAHRPRLSACLTFQGQVSTDILSSVASWALAAPAEKRQAIGLCAEEAA